MGAQSKLRANNISLAKDSQAEYSGSLTWFYVEKEDKIKAGQSGKCSHGCSGHDIFRRDAASNPAESVRSEFNMTLALCPNGNGLCVEV